jgi:hypothetical protein
MLGLISDLLDFSKIEADQAGYWRCWISIYSALLEDTAQMHEPLRAHEKEP